VPRNIYRGNGRSFATDALARQVVHDAVDAGLDRQLRPIERSFLYMPLMHSETLDDHRRCVECFEQLSTETRQAGLARAGYFEGNLKFAHSHRDIIERFGRYPHRNELLGRASTQAEITFLSGPNSSF